MTTLEPLKAHRLWAACYDDAPNPLLALETRTLAPLLGDLRGKRVVDVACGTGRWMRHCANLGAKVWGADLCRDMLLKAPGPVVVADAASLPFSSCFADLTICAFALSYAGSSLDELARITRPGGDVIVTDMHPDREWARSFRLGEETISIRPVRYRLSDLRHPSLNLAELIEAKLGPPERPIFERADKLDEFSRACAEPAVYVARWIRH